MTKSESKSPRLTKIVVTLGPALDSIEAIRKVMKAGANVFRANFSHGSKAEHQRRIDDIRSVAKELGTEVAILADLQGPKIRVARFQNKKIELAEGQAFTLDAELDTDAGDEKAVGIDYKELPQDVKSGDTLLLDDGRVVLTVKEVEGAKIHCIVVVGGELSNNKGINRSGGGLSAPALTEKDREDLKTAIAIGADYIAVSFPRSAKDIQEARSLIQAQEADTSIIAKIERVEAVDNIDEIIDAADGIMVARGDLGVEIGDAELPAVQKHIIQRTRVLNKPVITATQMLESMIENAIPTRAEVFDIANAVLDGTDAVMLSAESAVGKHPDKAVEAMARVCLGAERHPLSHTSDHRNATDFKEVDEAVAMASMYAANHLHIKAIVAVTESGKTPLWMSRIRTNIPIYGFSRHEDTRRMMALYRGVFPINFDATDVDRPQLNRAIISELQSRNILKEGDCVIITKGDMLGKEGNTNSMKVFKVGTNI